VILLEGATVPAFPDVQIIATCDVSRGNRIGARDMAERQYAQQKTDGTYKGCKEYNDFRDLLGREDIDAVMIATPDHWHAIPTILAAKSGKDIYCEKPLGLTVAEGRAMSDAVKRYGTVFQTGSQQRSIECMRRGCELVRNGRIGRVHTVEAGFGAGYLCLNPSPVQPVPEGLDYDLWLGQAPWAPFTPDRLNFRWIYDYAGGITDWAAHHCDIAQWGLGKEYSGPVEVDGKGVFPPPTNGVFDTTISHDIWCTYADGIRLHLHPKYPNGVRFIGDQGWIQVSRESIETYPDSLRREKLRPEELHLGTSVNHHYNFIECVKSRLEPIAPIEQAHRSITIAHLGNISMRLGRKIKWNPDTETIQDDPVAARMLSRSMRSPWSLY
jgi:predicted dehydrogenase